MNVVNVYSRWSRTGTAPFLKFLCGYLCVSCSEILTSWVMDLYCVVSDPTSDDGRGWWFEVTLLERSFASVQLPSSGLHFERFLSGCVGKRFQAFP